MPYFLIIALQGFCVYHAIKTRNEYYWFFVIIFLPVIGSIIYLVTQVFNKKDLDTVQKSIVNVANPTKKITELKNRVEFADTFQNRVDLGDALYEIGDYKGGIIEYEVVLQSNYHTDIGVIKKILEGYYRIEAYEKVILYAEKIINEPGFKGSTSQFLYGLSLAEEGKTKEAEEHLRSIDQRYSHYEERYTLAQFLIEIGKTMDAREILSDIVSESEHMSKNNRNQYRGVVNDVKKLLDTL
ncbi:CDC27 family protein [Aquimarina sp. RZ0]|uniref:CDC27 family protein n=1 Tax=Aquimarina sp. RZ0 TaxID=2607730 RepID=UPI0011F145C9|nr:CDC27 family protein [Aquimarina sp. RZ0]KAA1247934.1 hypothetical protein F0000_01560 [Aquimarina sp. RZ0]